MGPLVLLSGYQTPAALRRLGRRRLTAWLRNRKTRSAEDLATAAVDAAERQHTRLPGEAAIARVVRDLALELLDLHEKIHELDIRIEARFRAHDLAPVISSMPGIGPLLGAEFLAATGGDLSRFPSADRLAAFSEGVKSVSGSGRVPVARGIPGGRVVPGGSG
ncbi:transposase [Streptomyces sp. NPDC085944]|uniref:transposase n=1 Tax=Streptomyces sp. NPDC085944 TaxID=3154962 RepID=UPI00344689A3